MRSINLTIAAISLIALSFAERLPANSGGDGFAQIVITFPGERPFNYEWNKKENTLLFHFPKSSPEELEAVNNYDERLIRRVIVKDLGPQGSDIRMVLRSRDVQATVNTFKDPFRVSIDLFERGYQEAKDPETGLPVTISPAAPKSGSAAYEWMQSATPESQTAKPKANLDAKQPRRRLLQALPEEVNSPNELKAALAKIEPGVGKSWATFPPYIYRMQLAPYEGREAPTGETSPLQIKAVSTSTAMADYASKLYDFGHEGRALLAYQQVLQREPEVFERDAVHLWKFAETHLGQGNLTLAEGYYQTLIEKHPEHMMARFAKLRKLDIQAIRAIGEGDATRLAKIKEQALTIPTRDNAELTAMIMIRDIWWGDGTIDQKSRKSLPLCDEEAEMRLSKISPRIENPKTAYFASAIIARRRTNKDTPWQNEYGPWLANFFDRYKGPQTADIKGSLTGAAQERILQQFHSLFKAGKTADVVGLLESLPKESRDISRDPQLSWEIAESYRSLGQSESAIPFYLQAAKSSSVTDGFKSNFWIAALASKKAAAMQAAAGDQAKIRSYSNNAKRADVAMNDIWSKLKSDEKSIVLTALSQPIQDIVASEAKLRTPPKILLEQYKTALTSSAPKMNATSGTATSDWTGNFSPSASTVRLLDDLGQKFAELGMTNERRKALELMKFLKPVLFEQDKEAAKKWAAELTNLAEEHRRADEFLEAGELYTLVGDSAVLTEQKAEALYKGGLLLFRAGKKQDAIKALEKAKADTDNLFYSKLATERLNQLDTK
jgi:hypothetical protein